MLNPYFKYKNKLKIVGYQKHHKNTFTHSSYTAMANICVGFQEEKLFEINK